MSADHDALMRRAKQLMVKKMAMLNAMEALRQELKQHLDDSYARIICTRQLLADSSALLLAVKNPSRPRD